MRRILMLLGSVMLLTTLVLCALPAFAANVAVTNTGAAGDCAGNFGYDPSATSVAPGDSVTFTNPRVHSNGCASEGHPTQCLGAQSKGECPWKDVKDLPSGGQFTVSFPDEGTFKYRCVAHPYMEGTVTVGDGDPSEPSPEPTSEPEPTTPPASSEPDPEPTSEPEPEPTSDEPTQDEGSEPASDETSSEDPGEPRTNPTTAPDEPAPDEPAPDEPDDEPTTAATSEPDDPETEPVSAEGAAGDDDVEGGSGGGTRALATVLVLVTGGAVWNVRRDG